MIAWLVDRSYSGGQSGRGGSARKRLHLLKLTLATNSKLFGVKLGGSKNELEGR